MRRTHQGITRHRGIWPIPFCSVFPNSFPRYFRSPFPLSLPQSRTSQQKTNELPDNFPLSVAQGPVQALVGTSKHPPRLRWSVILESTPQAVGVTGQGLDAWSIVCPRLVPTKKKSMLELNLSPELEVFLRKLEVLVR
ncbi:hypothetical protein H0G86_011378 [Trichoderma simmonsii]|uniref:Uncharacterized protein n=1 Tax=Trichoderma simmonsii TaxID=1491479 RepID=A0A8G0LLZ9_9HYPO|nr:hypothetical protein H0G86_011378 [Trichoderma simmonsii]